MFKTLDLENFTVFEKSSFEWVEGINVFVGENGTGKTHLLKLLYCAKTGGSDLTKFKDIFYNNFVPTGENNTNLIRQLSGMTEASVKFFYESHVLVFYLWALQTQDSLSSGLKFRTAPWSVNTGSVYIPPKEVLSTAPGFLSLYRKYHIPVDKVYADIVDLAYIPHLRQQDIRYSLALTELEEIIGGQVHLKGDVFFVGNRTMHLVAEGHRKLALLWQLISNGSIDSGTTLLWDEPEANLNPSLMKEVVKVLLMLAQNGVQIFVATHSDAFMRELDYQKGEVPTRFFALEKTDQGVISHPAERYLDVKPNPIEDEYARLYDLEVRRSLGLL